MRSEEYLISEIRNELPSVLGDGYSVLPAVSDYYAYSPDILIKNNDTGYLSVIEFKGSSPRDELPYAVVPSLRKLRSSANFENLLGKVILVSLSKVSNSLKQYLSNDNVSLIEVSNKNQSVTNQIKDIITNSKS